MPEERGPWQDYQPSATSAGPWQDYQPPAAPAERPGLLQRAYQATVLPAAVAIAKDPLGATPEIAKQIFMQPGTRANQAIEAFRKGNIQEGLGRSLEAIPILGMAAEVGDVMAQDLQPDAQGNRNYRGAVGSLLGLVAPAALHAASETAPVRAAGAGIKAAAPDVALGTGKIAVGAALAKAGVPGIARELLGWEYGIKPGAKQIGRGLSTGYEALKKAYADAAAVEAEAARPPVAAEPAGAAPEAAPAPAPESPSAAPDPPPAAPTPAEQPAAGPSPELLDQIAMDLSGKPFGKLQAKGQAIVRGVAEKFARPEPTGSPSEPAPAAPMPQPPTLPEYTGSYAPGTDAAALIQQELAARRAAQAAAAPAEAPTPAEPPPAAPAAAVAPEPAPMEQPPIAAAPEITPGMAPDEVAAEIRARKQAAAEAKIQGARAKAADNIAKHLNDAGFTLADIDAQPPEIQEQFWKNAGGAHRKGYTPSPDTIDAVRERMGRMEAAKNAPAPEPAPAPAPPDVIAETARQLKAAGNTAAIVAKYTPDMLRSIGIQPYQVKPLLRAMMAEEPPPAAKAAVASQ